MALAVRRDHRSPDLAGADEAARRPPLTSYEAEVVRVLDSDRIRVRAELGLGMTVETELLVAGVVAPPAGTAASIAAHAAVVDWCLAFAYRVELLVDNVNERPWRGRVRRGTADLTEYLGAVGVVELGRRS